MQSVAPRRLAPAPSRIPHLDGNPQVTFLDLPAELRIEIYKRALSGVKIHILPATGDATARVPHPLTLTSRQVRREVLPLMHAMCPIECKVSEFEFEGMMAWMSRIPADQEANLCKNPDLRISLCTGAQPPKSLGSLRAWLRYRADKFRPQPRWQYQGPRPSDRVCTDLRRRLLRMREEGKRDEMIVLLKALQVPTDRGAKTNRGANS